MDLGAFKFSIPEHAIRLDGYMDAVGRVVTTDSELYGLSAQKVSGDAEIAAILGVAIQGRSLVQNWSKEFSTLAGQFLGFEIENRERV